MKSALYARAKIAEYWIVNVRDEVVEVYADPDASEGHYRTQATRGGGATLKPAGIPGLTIDVEELFD